MVRPIYFDRRVAPRVSHGKVKRNLKAAKGASVRKSSGRQKKLACLGCFEIESKTYHTNYGDIYAV
jgi:hypothetical protein